MTGALFEPVRPEPLRLPGGADVERGAALYSKYTAKNPARCDDCVRVLYEANRTDGSAPPIRQARWKRSVAGSSSLLCAEHKNLREASDFA